MAKAGRKGRVSNELVAASFAAILTVYGAGYWRTREEARRFGSEAQERRPVQPLPAVPAPPAPPASVPAATSVGAPQPVVSELQAATTQSAKVAAAPSKPLAEKPAATPAPEQKAVTAAPAPVAKKTELSEPPVVAADAPEFRTPPDVTWHDGYYTGWGQSFHGDLEARVTIKDGRIVEAGIARCETRYPCSVVDNILYQPVQRQSPDVDRVSRATESSDAYYFGLVQALKKAEVEPASAAASP